MNDKVEIIVNDQGNIITPSYVAFTESQRMIGDSAFNMAVCNPINTVATSSYTISSQQYPNHRRCGDNDNQNQSTQQPPKTTPISSKQINGYMQTNPS
ncbi:hypothetical protein TSUD_287780 [Trifolium subterraneum]|uniref:Uncharacterized protein n=1 Tax=Trifolium subterraneum TaxID=3900 RepID=A0A2Z6NC63_TRISU|nr:hypothetical protein TSUD_287780 [Trifolium subterraneum]